MNVKILFEKFPELETKRLYLRQVRLRDINSLHAILNDPDAVERISYGKTFNILECHETIINFYPDYFNDQKGIIWGMYLKSDNSLIGIRMCYIDSFEEPGTIQGQILKSYRNQGFTFEAYIEIIKFLRRAEVKGIKANCDKDNKEANGLLEKLGFIKTYNAFPMFSPNPNANRYLKDLTIENTRFFNITKMENAKTFSEACEYALRKYSQKELAFADDYINMAIQLEPDNPQGYMLKAKIVRALDSIVSGIPLYRKVIKLDRNLSEAYRELGICLYMIGDRSGAHENWIKAVHLGDEEAKELISINPDSY